MRQVQQPRRDLLRQRQHTVHCAVIPISICTFVLHSTVAFNSKFTTPPPSLSAPAVQRAYLKASNTGNYDEFVSSVALDGDTLVVGAPYEDSNATGVNGDQILASSTAAPSTSSLAAVRHGRNRSTWRHPRPAYDCFGSIIALDGDRVAVVLEKEDSNSTGVNNDDTNNFVSDKRRRVRLCVVVHPA